MATHPLAILILWGGAFFLAYLGKTYVRRLAGRNFFLLVLAALVVEAALLALIAAAQADPLRSRSLRAEFQRLNPCPANGERRGACPGFEVDHAVPLCLGGPRVDTISNLRWMTVEDHRRKTREDVRLCRQAGSLQ